MTEVNSLTKQTAAAWAAHRELVLKAIEHLDGQPVPEECIPLIVVGYAAGYADGIIDTVTERGEHYVDM